MANGHVEIHDPFSNHKDLSSSKDCEPTSDTESMEGTTEFRVLMAYAERRHSSRQPKEVEKDNKLVAQGGLPGSPQQPEKTEKEDTEKKIKREKKKKTKKVLNCLPKILSCISSQTKPSDLSPTTEEPDVNFRCGDSKEDSATNQVKEKEKLEEAVSRLSEIADEIQFIPPDVETDSPDDVEKVIGLLLRDAGDNLNEQQEEELRRVMSGIFWNYTFFDRLITTLLTRMGFLPSSSDPPGAQTSPKTQIAVTCEVTSRLSAADTLPVNRLFGLGARYLQEHYSTWALQQGGYEEAFYSEGEDDDDEDDGQ
ncbi:apoptosis facilitator Bcl-2-like protein 14 [Cheilinus undulatus]|uniref:apoptosis facilitator Bcl-2-like protein 14 n=1 Tax=Cheilinus undulatus TaxID=241271 RepID=UPI001BD59D14|nr:apoptosis facilitator Bcl-2-like protein 14 [Cheilinus undulatus]XP_041636259.1 apoptosis facilitator Bcl-2-like protein 14 [Cheilinus undulatus]